MAITNNGKTPDRVSCVSSDASAQCQIHTMATEDGVMKMDYLGLLDGPFKIAPGGYTILNLITDLTQTTQFRTRAVGATQ